MSMIHVLDEPTINQIAAGEVVERPSAVVKELIENAVDAGATAITAEIKEGGLSLIRITDNGAGIEKEDIPLAFLRHATSKILTAQDLLSVTSLGFRGEALSSIAAVSQVEVITKTSSSLNGFRYLIEGGVEKSLEEIGCPSGTTILVRNIFYNTPARRKFLKSAITEAGYISDLMERLMVSHPSISFKYIVNNQVKLQSSGNNNSKDILYHVYGRDIAKELLPVQFVSEEIKITGYIGKPLLTRGNRNYENYFINGRYIKSAVISKAIEEAYKSYLMQHKYPFTSLYLEIDPSQIDVNVHPQKLEVRLKNSEEIYQLLMNVIRNVISGKELIPKVTLTKQEEPLVETVKLPEPFEENRRKNLSISEQAKDELIREKSGYHISEQKPNPELSLKFLSDLSETLSQNEKEGPKASELAHSFEQVHSSELVKTSESVQTQGLVQNQGLVQTSETVKTLESEKTSESVKTSEAVQTLEQINLFTQPEASSNAPFLSKKAFEEHRIIGQVFATYWLVEYKKELFIIDQHAAHEKVLYEKIMSAAKEKAYESQFLLPPLVLSLTLSEQEVLTKYEEVLIRLGYEFEHFGGNEYSFRAVPADLYGLSEKKLLLEFMDDLSEDVGGNTPSSTSIYERVASLSCKAAVKANHSFSFEEATSLIKELLTLENPYHCPHGRPVIISMSQYELEKKFKRIV